MEVLLKILLVAYLLCGLGISVTLGAFQLVRREYAIGAACVVLAIVHLAGLILFY